MNNSNVTVDSIGEGNAGLHCVTNNMNCCSGRNRKGEFYYPNGTVVSISRYGHGFYRNRGEKLVRLNRRDAAQFPVGEYRCVIPDTDGMNQNLYINIDKN